MFSVDLNSDLGESFGAYTIGMDSEIIKLVSSVNVACGWHAGDPSVMDRTVRLCKEFGVAIGAHPGYLDLMGFGRRSMKISFEEAKNAVKYQLGALMAFTKSHGVKMQHLKAHGAFANDAAKNEQMGRAICEAVYEVDKDIAILSFANCVVLKVAQEMGLRFANEIFADRAYNDDYTLVARGTPGSMIHDPQVATKRVIRMIKENKVESINGKDLDIQVHSVCVHGDNPTAVEIVNNLKNALASEGISIRNIDAIIG